MRTAMKHSNGPSEQALRDTQILEEIKRMNTHNITYQTAGYLRQHSEYQILIDVAHAVRMGRLSFSRKILEDFLYRTRPALPSRHGHVNKRTNSQYA